MYSSDQQRIQYLVEFSLPGDHTGEEGEGEETRGREEEGGGEGSKGESEDEEVKNGRLLSESGLCVLAMWRHLTPFLYSPLPSPLPPFLFPCLHDECTCMHVDVSCFCHNIVTEV